MQYRRAGTNAGDMAGEQATGGPIRATGRAHPWPSGQCGRADQPVLHTGSHLADRVGTTPYRRFAFALGSRCVTDEHRSDRRQRFLSGGRAAARQSLFQPLPGGARDIRGDDVGSMPVEAAPARSYRVVVRGSACDAASCTSRSGTPASSAAVMNACLSVRGVTALPMPARRATLRMTLPALCRSSRRPSAAWNTGPPVRSPMARSIARAVRGASGMVTTLPPLRVMVRVRCPRSRPRCSMSAPVASDTRSPFKASSEISACSAGGPSPAATSSAPSSLRSSATAWDS